MRYIESFSSFFTNPKWAMQLLLQSVCVLIPMVGPIVLQGYHLEVLVAQHKNRGAPYPEFDFDRFVPYLMHGIWPFVANLVSALLAMPLMIVAVMPIVAVAFLGGGEEMAAVGGLVTLLLVIVLSFGLGIILLPFQLRIWLGQGFDNAFSMQFIRDFAGRMWLEIVLIQLFMIVVSIPLFLAGMLACFVGMYAVMALMIFASFQLYRQLYELYLERGGRPLEFHPELTVEPAPQAG